jgi:hypothetical protein
MENVSQNQKTMANARNFIQYTQLIANSRLKTLFSPYLSSVFQPRPKTFLSIFFPSEQNHSI